MPFSLFMPVKATECAGLPGLRLLGKELTQPCLDQYGFEHTLIAAFISNIKFH